MCALFGFLFACFIYFGLLFSLGIYLELLLADYVNYWKAEMSKL